MRRALIVLGLIACGRRAPSVVTVDRTRVPIAVTASFPGTDAIAMAAQVTTPLEHYVGQVAGIERLHSRTIDGATEIVAEFPAGTDGATAAEAILGAVREANRTLPAQMSPALVTRGGLTGAVMRLTLGSDTLSSVDMTAVAHTVIERLERTNGVGRIESCGTVVPSRTVTVDPVALAARGKTVTELLARVEEWADRPAADPLDGFGITAIESAPRPPRCIAFDGTRRFVALTIMAQHGVDALEVRERLEHQIANVRAQLPAAVRMEVLPRARPLAFEVVFASDLSPEAKLAQVQAALPRNHQAVGELGITSSFVDDPAVAALHVVAAATDAPAIAAALAQHHLTVRAPTDHVVGIAGADPAALRAHATAVAEAIGRVSALRVVDQPGLASAPSTRFEIDRDAAARLGITMTEIGQALRLLVPGGTSVATLHAVEPADVFVTIAGDPIDALQLLHVGGAPLSSIVKVTRTSEPTVVFHEGLVPWVGIRVSGPLDALSDALAKLPVPAAIRRELREPD